MLTKEEITRHIKEALRHSPLRGRVRKVSLFGSQLHGNAKKESDIDLLIEFKNPVSLMDVVSLELDFTEHLGKHVDLRTPKSLSKYFRDEVLAEAVALYEVTKRMFGTEKVDQ
jgi:predicted nucleotidyltransferase